MKLKINHRLVFLVFATVFSSTALAQEIEEKLGNFSEFKVNNGVEVVIIPSEENRISISGHSKEKVDFEIIGERLEVGLNLESIWSNDNTLIKIYATSVETIDANQNSVVEVKEVLEGRNLVFRAQEGSAIYAQIDAENVDSKAVTGGLVQLRGKAESQNVDINTGGQFFGENLKTGRTEVYITAGGRAEVNASEYCKATAKLGGKIIVFGDPEKLDTKTSFGGNILEKN